MNNPGHIEVGDAMLAKYLSGETSPEEAAAVDQWVSASQENQKQLDQAMIVWAQIPGNKPWQLPDRERELEDFREKRSSKPKGSLRRFRWVAAAAILILITGATLLFITPAGRQKEAFSWITRKGGSIAVPDTLPDHSIVRLDNYATIRYPAHFTGASREISLQGSASFKVAANPEKPFIVTVGEVKIKVLGTSFKVRPDTAAISVEVLSGMVRLFRGDSGVTISAASTGVYDKATGQFSLIANPESAEKSFNFRNASLRQIAGKLEEAYGIQVIFENKQLENCTMSSTFDHRSLQFVLEVISITLNVHYRIDKSTVYLNGTGCN